KKDGDAADVLFELLAKTPLLCDGEFVFTPFTTADLTQFAHEAKKNKPVIENALDVEVRADILSKPMSQLNAFLKLAGMSCKLVKKRKLAGKMIYPYALDKKSYD